MACSDRRAICGGRRTRLDSLRAPRVHAAWYAERGLWWLVRCAELNLLADVAMGETVTVTTTIVGYRKVWARRRTEVAARVGRSGRQRH